MKLRHFKKIKNIEEIIQSDFKVKSNFSKIILPYS